MILGLINLVMYFGLLLMSMMGLRNSDPGYLAWKKFQHSSSMYLASEFLKLKCSVWFR